MYFENLICIGYQSMAQRLFLSLWIIALPFSLDCRAQTALEILERASQAMEPPIKFRLSVNGKACTVLQKRLDDGSMAIRMDIPGSASVARIETNRVSYEMYPKCKSAIDLGFMGTPSNSQISVVLGLIGGNRRQITEDELQPTSETEFGDKKCWKITQSIPDELLAKNRTEAEDGNPKDTVYYVEKQTYQLLGMETISKAGQRILQTKISNVENPVELSSELFAPPADFAILKPQSIVEYLTARESLNTSQRFEELKDQISARQAQTKAMLATATTNANGARRLSSQIIYYLPIFGACAFVFFILMAIWSQRRVAEKWKRLANDPAAAQAEITKMIDATNLSVWTRFISAPLVLKVFVIYAACALVGGLVLPFFVPIGGFSSVSVFRYTLPLFLTFSALSRLELRKSIYVMAALLVMYGALNASLVLSLQSMRRILPNSSRIDAFSIVLDLVMPITWALLLMTPSMQKWIRAKSDNEVQVNQLSTADLLYFMVVASLSMFASITLIRMTQ
jgi:hypothetical protein